MWWIRQYEAGVSWIQHQAPGQDKFVHTYAGLAVWLAAAMASGRGLRSPFPILVLIALEVVNESIDRVAHGSWMWHDTLGDVAATLFWPATIMILLRRRKGLKA